jgi:DNA gyrase inhibitor GyrI
MDVIPKRNEPQPFKNKACVSFSTKRTNERENVISVVIPGGSSLKSEIRVASE